MRDFILNVRAGAIKYTSIQDLNEMMDISVQTWHCNNFHMTLHEYLGMTKYEYQLWFQFPEKLIEIVSRGSFRI